MYIVTINREGHDRIHGKEFVPRQSSIMPEHPLWVSWSCTRSWWSGLLFYPMQIACDKRSSMLPNVCFLSGGSPCIESRCDLRSLLSPRMPKRPDGVRGGRYVAWTWFRIIYWLCRRLPLWRFPAGSIDEVRSRPVRIWLSLLFQHNSANPKAAIWSFYPPCESCLEVLWLLF